MLLIGDKLVSLDLVERFFCCDLDTCGGICCLDGDAGAPLTDDEDARIRDILPIVWDDMLPAARRAVREGGTSYIDPEGERVTQLSEGGACVFATLDNDNCWKCVLETACRSGRTDFLKPASCHLYPVRLKKVGSYTAVNYHRWKICKCAEVLGKAKNLRAYQFLEQPLRACFGDEWYDELALTCEEYLKSRSENNTESK